MKVQKLKCRDCFKKFYKPYLKDGLCPSCYEKEVGAPYKSPWTAAFLSIIPGLGHHYLGFKEKGGIYLIVFGISVVIPVIGWLMMPAAYIWPMVDAYQTAKRMNMRG